MNSGSKPYLMKSGVLACSRMRSPSTSSCSPPAKPMVTFNRRSDLVEVRERAARRTGCVSC